MSILVSDHADVLRALCGLMKLNGERLAQMNVNSAIAAHYAETSAVMNKDVLETHLEYSPDLPKTS